MYCNVTQRLVPVPCLSLSLSLVVRCRRDLFNVAGGPTPGLRLGRVEAGGVSCGGDQTGLDYVCSRIAVEDGEESPAEEWMSASVVGSAVRYQSVAGGKEGSPWAGGGDQKPETKEEDSMFVGCLAVCAAALQVALPVVESGEGQETWEVRWSGKMANSQGCECSSPCTAQRRSYRLGKVD